MEVLGFQVLNLGTLHHPAVPDKGHFCDPKSPGDFLHLTQYRFGVIRIALENLYSSTVFASLTRSKPLCMHSFCGLDTNM